jgi:hypothetical protein
MPLYKNCGRWKTFDCIFGFSVKSYVRNTINLSWNKILLTSVILDTSYDTYAARKKAGVLGNQWRLEIHREIRVSHGRDFILMCCEAIKVMY